MRGLRGAITVEENTEAAVLQATREVVAAMLEANQVKSEDIGAAIFTATDDITAAFPAKGARSLPGFDMVPLFDARQMDVDGALDHCIRVLMLIDTDKKQNELKHIFLGRAQALRPDLRK